MLIYGRMNNKTESHFIRSTDCTYVALANLQCKIVMVRDGVLSLPTWFSHDLRHDVLTSVCV